MSILTEEPHMNCWHQELEQAHLAQLDWPGNIRQLENAVYRAVVMSDGDQLTASDFPQMAGPPATTST